jgi:hypothetical protein
MNRIKKRVANGACNTDGLCLRIKVYSLAMMDTVVTLKIHKMQESS